MRVGERLTEAFRRLDLGLKEAAERTGVPYRTLQDYTRLQREPKAETIGQISTRLRVSCDWLMTGEGSMWKTGAGLSRDQEWLLQTWETLTPRQRDCWRGLLGEPPSVREPPAIHEDPAPPYPANAPDGSDEPAE